MTSKKAAAAAAAAPHSASPEDRRRKRAAAAEPPRCAGGPERGLKREGESRDLWCFSAAPLSAAPDLVLANAGARGEGTRPGPPRRGRWTTKFCFFFIFERICWRSRSEEKSSSARSFFRRRVALGFGFRRAFLALPYSLFRQQTTYLISLFEQK